MVRSFKCLLVLCILISPNILRAGDYGDVFKRWDIGLGIESLQIQDTSGTSQSSISSTGYGFNVGLNLPIIFSDSIPIALGINPAVHLSTVSVGDGILSIGMPILATLKYNNDAQFRPQSGWRFGAAIGAGIMFDYIIPMASDVNTLSSVFPTIMAEISLGKRKSGFPSLFKLRLTKPLGDAVHEDDGVIHSKTYYSLIFTTGF